MELCAAFKNNLRDLYHLELDEIADGIYVGSISSEYGDVVGSGVVDYEELYPDIIRPNYTTYCVCGHVIEVNCHVYCPGADLVLAVGNDCVKHFFEYGTKRVCLHCKKPNRCHTPLCSTCRELPQCVRCRKVGGAVRSTTSVCYSCDPPPPPGTCQTCLRRCDPKYQVCYGCRFPKKCNRCQKPCASKFSTCWACSQA